MRLLSCLPRGEGEGAGLLSVVWPASTGHLQAGPLAGREMRTDIGRNLRRVRCRCRNSALVRVVESPCWRHKDDKAQEILATARPSTTSGWLMALAACVSVLTSGAGLPQLPPLPHHPATHANGISELGQIHLPDSTPLGSKPASLPTEMSKKGSKYLCWPKYWLPFR